MATSIVDVIMALRAVAHHCCEDAKNHTIFRKSIFCRRISTSRVERLLRVHPSFEECLIDTCPTRFKIYNVRMMSAGVVRRLVLETLYSHTCGVILSSCKSSSRSSSLIRNMLGALPVWPSTASHLPRPQGRHKNSPISGQCVTIHAHGFELNRRWFV
jgi:hypothetical protein